MGLNSKEMNIDLNFVYVPKLISDVLTEVSAMDDFSKKLTKLNQFVVALEEELSKIEAFQRELPNCMILLKDGQFLFFFWGGGVGIFISFFKIFCIPF